VRTEDSKREARRKGEIVSDSEDEEAERKKGARRGGKGKQGKQGGDAVGEQSWKKQRKVKVKVEHKTYEQIVAEASDQAASGVGLVLDARSGEVSHVVQAVRTELTLQMKEVQSLAGLSLSNWTPTSDNMQLPELRHNLRLVMDATKADVDALAREGKTVVEKRKWAVREEHLARKRVEEAENRESSTPFW
jgi:tuftelin-interacting protein 11